MKQEDHVPQMLDLISSPAFCVRDGHIIHANHSAAEKGIAVGTEIETILCTGSLEYGEFSQGCLYLTIQTDFGTLGVSVNRIDGGDVFIVEDYDDQVELRAMALAAQELRDPLANVLMTTDRLFPIVASQVDPKTQGSLSQINRGLFQILRIVSNMSDAHQYQNSQISQQETLNIAALIEEIFEKTNALAPHTDVAIAFEGLDEPVYGLADAEKLERAIYNLLSNAMKYTPKGGCITGRLTRRQDMLFLTVQDSGPGIPNSLRPSIHSRYLREPAIENSRHGIGLGLVLVRTAAAAHGGTVLFEQPQGEGLRVTLTIRIRENTSPILRAPILRVDYAGERDHCLIELADSLPSALYHIEKRE